MVCVCVYMCVEGQHDLYFLLSITVKEVFLLLSNLCIRPLSLVYPQAHLPLLSESGAIVLTLHLTTLLTDLL